MLFLSILFSFGYSLLWSLQYTCCYVFILLSCSVFFYSFCSVLPCFIFCCVFFFFSQKTAYEVRISDWSSDVCSSDLCCWMVRPGNSVINTAVGPFHQGSGTMSRNRSSLSCIWSLKLATPCVTEPLPPSPRVEIMAAWRKCESIFSADRLSARHNPKVTNQVCSKPGW